MPAIYHHARVVVAEDIDDLGHASNLAYIRWTLDAASAHSDAQGWTAEAYRRAGIVFVVRRHEFRYLRPTKAGERIVVRTWVASVERFTSTRRYAIEREGSGEKLVSGATEWALVDLARGAPARIPPELQGAFEIVDDLRPGAGD